MRVCIELRCENCSHVYGVTEYGSTALEMEPGDGPLLTYRCPKCGYTRGLVVSVSAEMDGQAGEMNEVERGQVGQAILVLCVILAAILVAVFSKP